MVVSGGVRYIWIGDAMTEVTGVSPASDFSGNTGIAFGVKVAIKLN